MYININYLKSEDTVGTIRNIFAVAIPFLIIICCNVLYQELSVMLSEWRKLSKTPPGIESSFNVSIMQEIRKILWEN